MASKYVNINKSFDGSGGTGNDYLSPWEWSDFVANISAISESTTYYFKGVRSFSADPTNITLSATTTGISATISNWEGTNNIEEPWSIINLSAGNLVFNHNNIDKIKYRNGRFQNIQSESWQGGEGSVYWIEFFGNGQTTLDFDNMHFHLNAGAEVDNIHASVVVWECDNVNVTNSNIYCVSGDFEFKYGSSNTGSLTYNFYNSIIYGADTPILVHYYKNPSEIGVYSVNFNQVVTNKNSDDLLGNVSWTTDYPTSSFDNMQYSAGFLSATVLSAANVSAITSASLYYQEGGLEQITINGTSSLSPSFSPTLYNNTQRDGVGSLYFPILNSVLSATPISGTVPVNVNFSVILSGNNISAGYSDYTFGDGNISASVEALTASHVYDTIGNYTPSVELSAINNWYSITDTLDFAISAQGVLSATIVVLDAVTSAAITSAYINNTVAISSTYVSGSPTTYDVLWGDGTSGGPYTVVDSRIYQEHVYDDGGSYDISAVLTNDASQEFIASTGIVIIEEVSRRTLYVDINRSYDTTASHSGTSADPLDYGEFALMVLSGGTGVNLDKYKLRGYRELTATSEVLDTNYAAGYLIDAWDLSSYGPWMIVKNDAYLDAQTMSFAGSHIRGGIYYNKLRDSAYGSPIELSRATNMFIVNHGVNSKISSLAYETSVSALSAYTLSAFQYSYIDDNFDSSAFDPWWDDNFSSSGTLTAFTSTPSNIGVKLDNLSSYIQITSAINANGVDLVVEWTIQQPPSPGANRSIKIGIQDCTGNTFAMVHEEDNGEQTTYSGTGGNFLEDTLNTDIVDISANAYMYLKIVRSGTSYLTSGWWSSAVGEWNYVEDANAQFSSCPVTVWAEGSTNGLFSEVAISAVGTVASATGLPYDYYETTATSAYYLVSAIGGIEIVGSTVYTGKGFEVGRVYSDASLSALSADFVIIDSVVTGLTALSETSAVKISIFNSTFDKSYGQISTDFDVSANVNSQYGWTRPTNYPFTIGAGSTYGYGQNLTWLSAHPSVIAPFSEISRPPNPGLNFSAYPGYQTGLFGYDRATYEDQAG